jgi:hypothetical protein
VLVLGCKVSVMDEILRFAQNDNWGAQNNSLVSVTLSRSPERSEGAVKGLIFWEVLTLMVENRHWNLLWR